MTQFFYKIRKLTFFSSRPVNLKYSSVTASTGKNPMVAPYSGAMFAMVARSAKDNSPIPLPAHNTQDYL